MLFRSVAFPANTLAMPGIEVGNASSQDSLVIQELLPLKMRLLSLQMRLAAQWPAGTDTRSHFDSSALISCAKLGASQKNVMAKDVIEVVIDNGVAFITRPGQHTSRCEARLASQGGSNSDDSDMHKLQQLQMKLAIRLAETSYLQQSCKRHDHRFSSVLHFTL